MAERSDRRPLPTAPNSGAPAASPPLEGDEAALRARLDALSGALKERTEADRREAKARAGSSGDVGTAMGTGFRAASELAGGILVGGIMGWWLDRALGTKPVGLVVLLLLGMVAGGWNVYRIAARPTGANPARDSGAKETETTRD